MPPREEQGKNGQHSPWPWSTAPPGRSPGWMGLLAVTLQAVVLHWFFDASQIWFLQLWKPSKFTESMFGVGRDPCG